MSVTLKDLLQELLNETQSEMRKLMEAYRQLKFRELNLKEAIRKGEEK